jgi:hypothetical protein
LRTARPVTRRTWLFPPFASAAHPTDSADPTSFAIHGARRAHWGHFMPIVLLAALAALGLSAREVSVSHHQHDVMSQAQARYIAVHDPACQDSLRTAATDSARATIVDACTQRVIENGMRSTTKRVADSK